MLVRLLCGSAGEFILGDLEEEYRWRTAHGAFRLGPAIWYWKLALASIASRWSPSALRSRLGSGSGKTAADRIGSGKTGAEKTGAGAIGAGKTGSDKNDPPRRGPSIRDAPKAGILDGLARDVRHALRTVLRQPGFTAVTVLTLALGIGASAAIYSVVDAVVLQPLPYPEPHRLVNFSEVDPQGGLFSISEPNFLDFRDRNRTLTDMAAVRSDRLSLIGEGEPTQVDVAIVSPSLFGLLGARPVVGRTFTAREGVVFRGGSRDAGGDAGSRNAGGDTGSGNAGGGAGSGGNDNRVVVLAHRVWQERFGGDPEILGQEVTLSGAPHVIVGVLEPGFDFPDDPDAWLPLAPDPGHSRDDHDLDAIGRLRPGISLEAARDDLEAVAARLGDEYPDSNAGWTVDLVTFPEWLIGPSMRRAMIALAAAVGLLLLLACANVANLLIARATSRQREIGVRAALGATRARIVRQSITESLVLGVCGALLGFGLAYVVVPVVQYFSPEGVPRLEEASVGGAALLFAAVLAFAVVPLFGLAPAVYAAADPREGLRGRGDSARVGARRLREALVVAEVTLAMILLVGAGLLVDSFLQLQGTDPGYEVDAVLSVPVSLTGSGYEADDRRRLLRRVAERLEAIPGVVAADATNVNPMGGGGTVNRFRIEGRPVSGTDEHPFADWRAVTPGYFETIGLPLLQGRRFTPGDTAPDARPVAMVSETLARRFWPGEDPLGKRLGWGAEGDTWFEIVGVVADLRDRTLDTEPLPVFFFPEQGWWPWMTLLVRAERDPSAVAGAVRSAIWEVDPNLPVPTVEPLAERVAGSIARPRFNTLLMGVFAASALALAAIGVYGIMAFAVSRRVREIGVRMALGARPASILALVLGHAMRLVGAGIAIGTLCALALSRFLESLLYETAPTDALPYVVVASVLGIVAAVATLVPGRRAVRIDPTTALARD